MRNPVPLLNLDGASVLTPTVSVKLSSSDLTVLWTKWNGSTKKKKFSRPRYGNHIRQFIIWVHRWIITRLSERSWLDSQTQNRNCRTSPPTFLVVPVNLWHPGWKSLISEPSHTVLGGFVFSSKSQETRRNTQRHLRKFRMNDKTFGDEVKVV